MFGDIEGGHRHPERFSRRWNLTVRRAISEGVDVPPIRLLGHKSVTVTLTVYAHVLPGDQKRAASRFAALIGEVA